MEDVGQRTVIYTTSSCIFHTEFLCWLTAEGKTAQSDVVAMLQQNLAMKKGVFMGYVIIKPQLWEHT